MKVLFAAHTRDAIGLAAIDLLKECGYATSIVEDEACIDPSAIAVFDAGHDLGKRRRIRIAPYRMAQEGIATPSWAEGALFQIAVSQGATREKLKLALEGVAETHGAWGMGSVDENPGGPVGTALERCTA